MSEAQQGGRAALLELERTMFDMGEHHLEIETRHTFAAGVYVREVTIPAGALVVGKIHRTEHVTIVSQGRAIVVTENGGETVQRETVQAPATWVAPPGVKRAVLALEDTVWSTIHPTHERDLDEIERQFIAPSYEALEQQQDEG